MTARYQPRARQQAAKAPIDIVESLTDRLLLGAAIGDLKSWSRWTAVLKAAFALKMSPKDVEAFKEVAGNREPPKQRVNEFWAVCGRRSGKTRIAAAISVYIGAIEQHKLASGEVGYVLLLAATQAQAKVAFEYVVGFLRSSPILRQQIVGDTASEVRLKGNIVIGVHAGSYRSIRGRTLLAVVGDETSFWRDETSALPDVEVFRAVTPALIASKGLWVGISTGYRKTGLLYDKWRKHFAQDTDDVLVIQGASRQFNATLDSRMITRASESDPEAAESEWLGGFRADISSFLDEDTIESVTDYSRPLELPPRHQIWYSAFCDASGGRHDHFTLAIGHKEGIGDGAYYILDLCRGRAPPFNPDDVVAEYAALLKDYRLYEVTGDNYSAGWIESSFNRAGVKYERSELNKSTLYLEALPLFCRQAIALPNHPKLQREFRLLERRTTRLGKDLVDHPIHGCDDYANAVAGCLDNLATMADPLFRWVSGDEDPNEDGRKTHAAWLLTAYLQSHGVIL